MGFSLKKVFQSKSGNAGSGDEEKQPVKPAWKEKTAKSASAPSASVQSDPAPSAPAQGDPETEAQLHAEHPAAGAAPGDSSLLDAIQDVGGRVDNRSQEVQNTVLNTASEQNSVIQSIFRLIDERTMDRADLNRRRKEAWSVISDSLSEVRNGLAHLSDNFDHLRKDGSRVHFPFTLEHLENFVAEIRMEGKLATERVEKSLSDLRDAQWARIEDMLQSLRHAERERVDGVLRALREEGERRLSDVQRLAELRVTETSSSAEQRLSQLQSAAEARLAEAKALHEQHLTDAGGAAERLLAEARSVHERQLAEAGSIADRRVAELAASADRRVSDVNASADLRLQDIRRAAEERLLDSGRSAEGRIAEIQAAAEARVAGMTQLQERHLADLQEAHRQCLSEVQNGADLRVFDASRAGDERVSSQREIRREKLGDIERLYQEQINHLEAAFKGQIEVVNWEREVARREKDIERLSRETLSREKELLLRETRQREREALLGRLAVLETIETRLRAAETALGAKEKAIARRDGDKEARKASLFQRVFAKEEMRRQEAERDALESRLREQETEQLENLRARRDSLEEVRGMLLAGLTADDVDVMRCVGQYFQPERHEKVREVPAAFPAMVGTVVEVVRRGFTWKGEVLRPAHVSVAVQAAPSSPSAPPAPATQPAAAPPS